MFANRHIAIACWQIFWMVADWSCGWLLMLTDIVDGCWLTLWMDAYWSCGWLLTDLVDGCWLILWMVVDWSCGWLLTDLVDGYWLILGMAPDWSCGWLLTDLGDGSWLILWMVADWPCGWLLTDLGVYGCCLMLSGGADNWLQISVYKIYRPGIILTVACWHNWRCRCTIRRCCFLFVHSFATRGLFNLIKPMVWFTGLTRPAGYSKCRAK